MLTAEEEDLSYHASVQLTAHCSGFCALPDYLSGLSGTLCASADRLAEEEDLSYHFIIQCKNINS